MSQGRDADLTVPLNDHDHSTGRADAPIILLEYGDFECDSCLRAYPIVKRIREQFGDDLRFVWRNFPIVETHPHAERAAEAAESAATQGKFWEMHDTLFEHQPEFEDAQLKMYAKETGCDEEQFDRDLAERTHLQHIRQDYQSGLDSGVSGTPTFFINGKRHEGFFRYEVLVEAIERTKA